MSRLAHRKIKQTIITLRHTLDMRLATEDVKTVANAMLLTKLSCNFAHGFLFGLPLAPAELTGLIRC